MPKVTKGKNVKANKENNASNVQPKQQGKHGLSSKAGRDTISSVSFVVPHSIKSASSWEMCQEQEKKGNEELLLLLEKSVQGAIKGAEISKNVVKHQREICNHIKKMSTDLGISDDSLRPAEELLAENEKVVMIYEEKIVRSRAIYEKFKRRHGNNT